MDLQTASNSEIVRAVLDIDQNHGEACRRIAAINRHLAEVNDWVFGEIRRQLGNDDRSGDV